jgi:hypothetical protein
MTAGFSATPPYEPDANNVLQVLALFPYMLSL